MTPEFTTIQLEIICQCSAYGRRKRLRGEGQSLFEHADDSTTVVHLATVYMIFFIDFAASLFFYFYHVLFFKSVTGCSF